MPYTYNKLRGRIVEIYGTQGKFAEKLGVSKNSVSKKNELPDGVFAGRYYTMVYTFKCEKR